MKYEYKVECCGNTSFKVYQKKRFLMFNYWSLMCSESSFSSAKTLVDNLCLINN